MKYMILIPPSEGKSTGGEYPPIQLSSEQKELLKRLKNYTGDKQKLLGLKEDAYNQAMQANNSLETQQTLPAIERYTGAVYKALDMQSLSTKEQEFAKKHIYMVSGLFGLIRADTCIPNYKFKISLLKADSFWKERIHIPKDTFVIDLLPQAHQKAITYEQGIRINFLKENNKPLGHHGKRLKGRFIRFLCQKQGFQEIYLKEFSEDNCVWNGDAFIQMKSPDK